MFRVYCHGPGEMMLARAMAVDGGMKRRKRGIDFCGSSLCYLTYFSEVVGRQPSSNRRNLCSYRERKE